MLHFHSIHTQEELLCNKWLKHSLISSVLPYAPVFSSLLLPSQHHSLPHSFQFFLIYNLPLTWNRGIQRQCVRHPKFGPLTIQDQGIWVAWWCNGQGIGLVIEQLWVWFAVGPLSSNNSRQVVHTHVPLSPSSIIWYRPSGGDALWLGRQP